MENYIYYHYPTSTVCKVAEQQAVYEKWPNVTKYLDALCLENGSTVSGRRKAYQYKMKQKKFTPVFINEQLIYFPTSSSRDPHCIWVNYAKIQTVQYQKKKCTIFFKDHTHIECQNPDRIRNILQSIRQYQQML